MKRIVAFVLSLFLAFCMFGCGGDNASEQTVPETSVMTETTVGSTEEETEPPVTEPTFDLSTWQGNFDQGQYFMEVGNWQGAFDAFDAAVEMDNQQADAYACRGDARIRLGETEENLSLAWDDYQQALTLDEDNALAYLGIVDVHIRRAEYDAAKAALADAVEKTNNDPLLGLMRGQLDRGLFIDSSGKTRYGRALYHDNTGKYVGCVITKYNNGVICSVESFDATGKSTAFLETSKVVDGNVTVNNWYDVSVQNDKGYVEVRRMVLTTIENPDGTYERESVGYSADGTVKSRSRTCYNADDKIIKEEHLDADGNLKSYDTTEYDSEGRKSRIVRYYPDGTLDQSIVYTYNEQGERDKAEFFNANNQLTSYTQYQYDEQGNPLGYESYTADGELMYSHTNQ